MITTVSSGSSYSEPLFMSYQIAESKNLEELDKFYTLRHLNFSQITWSLFLNKVCIFIKINPPMNEKKSKEMAMKNISYLQKASHLEIKFYNRDESCIRYIYTNSINTLFPNDAKKLTIARDYNILHLGNA
jgi:hypothetical protein